MRARSALASRLLWVLVTGAFAAAAPVWSAGEADPGFRVGEGFNQTVRALAVQSDGRLLCGGSFTTYQGRPAQCLARLDPDGAIDAEFAARARPNNPVRFIFPRPEGRILIGGDFTHIGNVPRSRLAWLLPDGSPDLTIQVDVGFDLGAVLELPGREWLLTGTFSQVAGVARSWAARLRADGSLDPAFNPGGSLFFGAGSPLLLPDGKLLLDASWTGSGAGPRRDLICRLHPDGTFDPAFEAVSPVGFIDSMARLPDGSVAVANSTGGVGRLFEDGPVDPDWPERVPAGYRRKFFSALRDGRTPCAVDSLTPTGGTNALHLLRADGEADTGFVAGFDGAVECVLELPDGDLLVGGSFGAVGALPSGRVARLRGAGGAGPTRVGWNGRRFAGEERAGVIPLPLLRTGSLDQPVSVQVTLRAVTAGPGTDFDASPRTVRFAPGEASQVLWVPLLDDTEPEAEETFEVVLTGDAVAPGESVATVLIHSDEGSIRFAEATLQTAEPGPSAVVRLQRAGGAPYGVEAGAAYAGGTAGAGDLNRPPLTFRFLPGSRLVELPVAVRDDAEVEPEETASWRLIQVPPNYRVRAPEEVLLLLADNDRPGAPGEALPAPAQLLGTPEGGVLLAGVFPTVHGQSRSNLARLLPDGRLDPAFAPVAAPSGLLLGTLGDGRFYVSHTLTNVVSTQRNTNFLARLRPDGTPDPGFIATNQWAAASPVRGVTLGDGSVVLESPQTDLNGVVQDLLKYDFEGRRVGAFASGAFAFSPAVSRVLVLERHGDGLLVGGTVFVPGVPPGSFGTPRRSDLFRLTATGQFEPGFECRLGGIPASTPLLQGLVVTPDQRIYVRGRFDRVDGQSRPGLARVQSNGSVDPSFAPPAGLIQASWAPVPQPAPPWAVQPDGRLVLVLPGADQLVRLQPDGPLDAAFGPVRAAPGAIQSLVALGDGRLVISGTFTTINGEPRWRLAWLDASGRLLPDHPLSLAARRAAPGEAVEVWVTSRVAGRVSLERSGPGWNWVPQAVYDVGATPTPVFTEPVPAGPAFFRARRVD